MSKAYVRNDSIVSRKIDDETILVPIRQNVGDLNSIYTLNKVGARIWDLLDGEITLQEIVKKITEEFDVTTEQAEKDAEEFIDRLKKIGAVINVEKQIS